jgi:putative flippase GtrA
MHINRNMNFIKLLSGFSIVGLVSTVISLALIYVFLKIMQTPLLATYVIIYISTIFLSFLLNSVLVFKTGLSIDNVIRYFIVYLSGMLLGIILLWLFKKIIPVENYIIGYAVIPFTMIWNFVLSFKLLKPIKSC